MSKQAEYTRLVSKRKACHLCPQLTNLSKACDGVFDSNRLGPASRWQGNLNSELVVVLQDYAPVGRLGEYQGWPDPTGQVRTNPNLTRLLREAGCPISLPPGGPIEHRKPEDRLFFTNAILCLKPGTTMGADVDPEQADNCGREFLRPLIELVRPRAVAALGTHAINATYRSSLGGSHHFDAHNRVGVLAKGPPILLPGGVHLFPMYHPSRLQHLEDQIQAWQRLGRWLGWIK